MKGGRGEGGGGEGGKIETLSQHFRRLLNSNTEAEAGVLVRKLSQLIPVS
jgi:hypothetical protein